MSWLPANWLDENVPDLADDPSDFIEKLDDGSFRLFLLPDDPERVDALDNGFYSVPLTEGAVVSFCEHEDFGMFDMLASETGRFHFDRDVPERANCFCLDEDFFDDVQELVNCGNEGGPLDGEYSIWVYRWSDGIPFRFEVTDGFGRFVRVDGAA